MALFCRSNGFFSSEKSAMQLRFFAKTRSFDPQTGRKSPKPTQRCGLTRPPQARKNRPTRQPDQASGRVAQRESTPFTREGSQVQSLSRPPFYKHTQHLLTFRMNELRQMAILRGASFDFMRLFSGSFPRIFSGYSRKAIGVFGHMFCHHGARLITPSSLVPRAIVLEIVPYFRTFVCSSSRR